MPIVPPSADGAQSAAGQFAVEWALDLLRLGYRLIPLWWLIDGRCTCADASCRSAGKHPIAALAPNGVKDGTSDPERVREWLARYPRMNVGGFRPGTFRLDVDDPEVFAQLQSQFGPLPPTVAMKTGNGGLHLEFKIPAGVELTRATPWSGAIDVRVAGLGYAVLPPSVTTGEYSWLPEGDPHQIQPAELPEPWLRVIRNHQRGSRDRNGDFAPADNAADIVLDSDVCAPPEKLAALLDRPPGPSAQLAFDVWVTQHTKPGTLPPVNAA